MRDEQGGQSKTLVRGLSMLRACATSRQGLTLVEIAERTELAPSTVHRLLTTLESLEFLSVDTETGRWRIAVAGFEIGNAFIRSRDFIAQLRPLMAELSEATGETVNLAILSDERALFVSQVESGHMMRMVAPLGSRAPLHASSAGKALLAGSSEETRDNIIEALEYPELTVHTLKTQKAYRLEIETVITEGCAYDREEHVVGMQCVAAPVFSEMGEPICALSISGPSVRMDAERLRNNAQAVRRACAEATKLLGGQPPAHWHAYD